MYERARGLSKPSDSTGCSLLKGRDVSQKFWAAKKQVASPVRSLVTVMACDGNEEQHSLEIGKEVHMKRMSAGFFRCNANDTRECGHVHCTVQASETPEPRVPKDMTRTHVFFKFKPFSTPVFVNSPCELWFSQSRLHTGVPSALKIPKPLSDTRHVLLTHSDLGPRVTSKHEQRRKHKSASKARKLSLLPFFRQITVRQKGSNWVKNDLSIASSMSLRWV